MKRIIFLLLSTTLILLISCNENTSVVNPTAESLDGINSKSFAKVVISDTVHIKYSKKVTIKKSEGGRINFSNQWVNSEDAGKRFECTLVIEPNTFEAEELTFNATFDPEQLSVDLDPHGTHFSKPLLLTLKFKGIDVNEYAINRDNFFQYIDETGSPSPEIIKYDALRISEEDSTVMVFNAQLWHFSRYGFTTNR